MTRIARRPTCGRIVAVLMTFVCSAAVFRVGPAVAAAPPVTAPTTVPAIKGVKIYYDVPYTRSGDVRQRLDIYVPENAARPLPVMVWVHGGGWNAGSKETGRGPVLLALENGCAAVSINYRFTRQAIHPAQIEDCKTAIRFLRAHAGEYGLDPQRIAAWGASAGGHLVSLLATLDEQTYRTDEYADQSSRVCGVISLCGPVNFFPLDDNPHAAEPVRGLLGGKAAEKPDVARAASPLTYISADDPPVWLIHAVGDPVVPHAQSVEFEAALKKAGVKVTRIDLPGESHGISMQNPLVRGATAQFIKTVLRGDEAAAPQQR